MTLELGQRVTYSRTLHRMFGDHGRRWWEPYPWAERSSHTHPELKGEGIVVGLRTFSNGRVRHYGDDGSEYEASERFPVVEIRHHIRRKSVFVRLEDAVPIDPVPHDSQEERP